MQGGVVDQQHPAFAHRDRQRAVGAGEGAVGLGYEPAGEVLGAGVAGTDQGQQVGERGFGKGGFAVAGWPGQQRRDPLDPQVAQDVDVGAFGEVPRVIQLPVGSGHRRGPAAGAAAAGGAGGRWWQGAGGVDPGLGDLESVWVGQVGDVAGGEHPLPDLEHGTGGWRADAFGDLSDLEHGAGMRGEVGRDEVVQRGGPPTAGAGNTGGVVGGAAGFFAHRVSREDGPVPPAAAHGQHKRIPAANGGCRGGSEGAGVRGG